MKEEAQRFLKELEGQNKIEHTEARILNGNQETEDITRHAIFIYKFTYIYKTMEHIKLVSLNVASLNNRVKRQRIAKHMTVKSRSNWFTGNTPNKRR